MVTGDGGFDIVTAVRRVSVRTTVHDLDIDSTHNFVAGGLVTHNSIYSWRGAKVENMTKLGKDFFGQRSDRWIIDIPVQLHLERTDGTIYSREDWISSTLIPTLRALSFPSSTPHAEQEAEVRRQYGAWKATLQRTFWKNLPGLLEIPAVN